MNLKQREEKRDIPRQTMAEQDPFERTANFHEVPYGLSEEQAIREGMRCLQCKKPGCVSGCPVNIEIPLFMKLAAEGRFIEAARTIRESNPLPAVCGRVCRQEEQCEKFCLKGKKGQAVAIGAMERFVADYEREMGQVSIPNIPPWTGKKAAVVGSGPAGLAVAGDLVKMGHRVTIFEALHVAGGVLMYGIPEFRLPKKIVEAEIDYLRMIGVEIMLNSVIGRIDTVDDLLSSGYDAVFVGSGAGLPIFMNVCGENLVGVYSANEYLTRVNLMRAYKFPEYDTPVLRGRKIAVIGGGNTAMDSARTARRLCPEEVTVVYRRSEDEMPARYEEIRHGREEGVKFMFLVAPTRFLGDREGRLRSMELIRMELSEPDESGRRKPVAVAGSEFQMEVDIAIVAIGNNVNPLIQSTTPGIAANRYGNIMADPDSGMTSKEGVFSGGDVVRGGATVILAMGDGRRAAKAMHRYMMAKTGGRRVALF
jgi:glutamate synthase (NADPH/NADH) small chain